MSPNALIKLEESQGFFIKQLARHILHIQQRTFKLLLRLAGGEAEVQGNSPSSTLTLEIECLVLDP